MWKAREKGKDIQVNADFQRIAKRDKKAFLNEQCKEVEENNRVGKSRDLLNKIRDIKETFHAKMGTIKDRNCKDLTEADGGGNGNPLQCSCLENPRDGGAWWAAVYGVAQSPTWPKRLSSSSSSNVKRIHNCLLLNFHYKGRFVKLKNSIMCNQFN